MCFSNGHFLILEKRCGKKQMKNQLDTDFPQEAEESPPFPTECTAVDTCESALLTWFLLFLV